jgi:serine/threonine protein kinase
LKYAFQTTDNLFLVTEFCPGGDLERLLTVEKYINEDRAKIYIAEIILSIAELHQKDIIYRDLKPDNVVIDEQGHASLIDFGMAKEGVKEVHKGADTFCGSIKYLAPEMLRKKGYGKSLDWYLVGVLLYEMLVGVTPYYT